MYALFEQKYVECEKSLFLIAIGYLHNTEDAKDCVQEATLVAWKSFNKLKNKEIFKTWNLPIKEINLDERGEYKILINNIYGLSKGYQPLKISGMWECEFTR